MRTALLLAAAMLAPLYGQQRDVFKLDLTIRDSGDAGGKTGRKYSVLVFGHDKGMFKVGNRVPVSTSAGSNTQFTYVDVGVNLECTIDEVGTRFGLRADLDLSTAINADKSPGVMPTISQIRLNISTAIPPAKPTVVASFDDPVTARKFDVEAMVTKVN